MQEKFGREVLFLHGGVPASKRDRMVERFQERAGRAARLFLLSLKAGGTGLNLTAANHVFHFDRWWNPAVENQATDRAFRIGQTRNVQVHKFLCVGTLEEKIDEMIERKQEVAERVVGAGEGWLTELSNDAVEGPVRPAPGSDRRNNDAIWILERLLPALSEIAAARGEGRHQGPVEARPFGQSWWAKRWIAVLESFDIGGRLGRGRSYARNGQVLSIDVSGEVKARCRDRCRNRTR